MKDDVARRGTLYVVATPIGNLQDLSSRALSTLASCRLIACEDTRTTRALLTRHGLRARLVSYHHHNESRRAPALLEALESGADVALVTEAGSPGVSDPGPQLVRRARAAGYDVVPIPGPSAVTALLSASGFPSGPFTFMGFLPARAAARRRVLESLREEPHLLVFFEAPHRLVRMLEDAIAILGDREACLGREMTKVHEEIICAKLSSLEAHFGEGPVRGEITLAIAGASGTKQRSYRRRATSTIEPLPTAVARLVDAGWDHKEAMRHVARRRGMSRRAVYQAVLRARGATSRGPDEEE